MRISTVFGIGSIILSRNTSGDPIVGGTIAPTLVNIQTTVAFSQQFTATGGTGPYTWSVSGTLPNGITLTGDTLSGTTTDVETTAYSFTIRAKDANGDYVTQAISGTVGAAYELPNGTILSSFATQLVDPRGLATDGTTLISTDATSKLIYIHSGISSSVTSSFASSATAPRGMAVDPATGNLIVADGAGFIRVHSGFTSTVLSTITAATSGLQGVAVVNGNLVASYQTGAIIYVYDGISGTVSTSFASPGAAARGLAFDGTNLISCDALTQLIYIHEGVSSTILSSFASPSTFPYGLTFDGTNLISCDNNSDLIYIHDKGPVAIVGGTIAPTLVNIQTTVAFSQQFTATGGTGPYTWSISGTLPTGITLTGDTLSGTTTDVETTAYSFTVRATDSNGDYIDQAISGTVQPPVSIELIGTATRAISTGTSTVTTTLPAGLLPGDLVVILKAGDTVLDDVDAVANGWTDIAITENGAGSRLLYKLMPDPVDSSVQLQRHSTKRNVCAIYAFSGVDQLTPIDTIPVSDIGVSSNVVSFPSITTVTDGAWAIAMAVLDDDDTTVVAFPSGYVNPLQENAGGGTSSATIGLATKLIATAGVVPAGTFTFNLSDNAIGHQMAIRRA